MKVIRKILSSVLIFGLLASSFSTYADTGSFQADTGTLPEAQQSPTLYGKETSETTEEESIAGDAVLSGSVLGTASYSGSGTFDTSLQSLLEQIGTDGIGIYGLLSEDGVGSGGPSEAETVLSPSGLDFNARVSYEINEPIYASYESDQTAVITFTLNKVNEQSVSFDYSIYSGSAFFGEHFDGTTTGTISFSPGETAKQLEIPILKLVNNPGNPVTPQQSSIGEFWTKDRIFYIDCYHLENALFNNDKETTIIPVTIENSFDFKQTYANATDTFLVDLDELSGMESIPGFSGGYRNLGDTAVLAEKAAIGGDVRTMIDTGVFSHLKFPSGYFINDGNSSGWVSFQIKSNYTWGTLDSFSRQNSVEDQSRIDFDPGEAALSEIGLGRSAEANSLIQSLDVSFDYSALDSTVDTVFRNPDDPNDDGSDYETLRHQMNFVDETQPQLMEASAPQNEFCVGESIPITVSFTEPVLSDEISIQVNGTSLHPIERNGTISETVSFIYEVGDDCAAPIIISDITGVTDLSGKSLDEASAGPCSLTDTLINTADIESLFAYCADPSVSVVIESDVSAKASITVSLKENYTLSTFLEQNKGGDGLMAVVKAKVIGKDGTAVDVPLYANDGLAVTELSGEFEVPVNTSEESLYYAAEIYLDAGGTGDFDLLFSVSQIYSVAPVVYIDDETDLEILYTGWPLNGKLSADSETTPVLSYLVKNNATWQSSGDFFWSSSDETVASVSASGTVMLTGKTGEVYFILTARNADIEGRQFHLDSSTLEIVDSGGAFLRISDGSKSVEVVEGNDAKIYYSTNITESNDSFAGAGTVTPYACILYEAGYEDGSLIKGPQVQSWTLNATAEAPVVSCAVDKAYLQNTAVRGRYSYLLEISAQDLKTGLVRSASAGISVKSLPAKAVLRKPNQYYLTDETRNFTVSFDVENQTDGTEIRLQVMKNGGASPAFQTTDISDAETDLNISLDDVSAERRYDVYTVSLTARNESDETESFDSYAFYVYNANAMKIMINGTLSDSYTMSMDAQLSAMTSQEILDLNRKLTLRDEVSLDNETYTWSRAYDKIRWAVGDDRIAALKSNSNGAYRDLDENISVYPDMKLIIEGISAGETSLTALHELTGQEETIEITVDDLRNKLFLFQVYPAQKARVEYTNGEGMKRVKETDDEGRLAAYERSGINSDVSFTPIAIDYYDSYELKKDELYANQNTSNYLGLFPQNYIILPRSSSSRYTAYLTVLDEESRGNYRGIYTGSLLVRGGVYRNGVYCPGAKLNGIPGTEFQTLDVTGYTCYKILFDPTEFVTEADPQPLRPEDEMEYVFEIRLPGVNHHPLFVKADSDMIREIRKGGDGVFLTANVSRTDPSENPAELNFMRRLLLDDTEAPISNTIAIEDPDKAAVLKTELYFDKEPGSTYEIRYTDKEGRDWSELSETVTESYEFSDKTVVRNTFDLQSYISNFRTGVVCRLSMQIVVKSGGSLKIINLPADYQIVLLDDIPSMNTLMDDMESIKDDIMDSVLGPASMLQSDKPGYVQEILKALTTFQVDTEAVRLIVIPTENPNLFKGELKISFGDLSRNNPSGVASMQRDSAFQYSYMPGPADYFEMSKGDYLSYSKQRMSDYKNGYVKGEKVYGGGVYIDCEIFYDGEDKEWKLLILKSDAYLGGGYSYKRVYNTWISFVPVTAEFMVGGTAQVGLKTMLKTNQISEEEYESYRNYITELRPYFYMKAFGGVGRDYDVVSFKAGPYGKLSLDQRYLWLNSDLGNKNGQAITLTGETGIEYEIKLLFVTVDGSYELGEVSKTWTYHDYNKIKKEYDGVSSLLGARSLLGMNEAEPESEMVLGVSCDVTFEDRSYLKNDRQWYTPGMLRAFSSGEASEPVIVLQTNAYPYSNPVLTEDGNLMVYLSDMDSPDITDTAVCFSVKTGSAFGEGTEIAESDYGDVDATVDGTAKFAAAAWTRVISDMELSEGEAADTEDLQNMMNATEIMAGIYDGSEFSVTRLTDNSTADMSPVVAVGGGRAIAAWRSLYSGSREDPLSFDGRDNIMYRMFDGSTWSDEKCLYDGSIDKVRALNVKMLSDGTAAITYEVWIRDAGDDDTETGNTEIYCVVIDRDGGIVNRIRLTNNEKKDERPHITSVIFPDDTERFVVGWNTNETDDGTDGTAGVPESGGEDDLAGIEEVSVIRLAAVGGDGKLYPEFDQEIKGGSMSDYTDFRFAKGAKKLTELSVLWTQPDFEEDGAYGVWGRKLIVRSDESISVSPEMKLLSLDPYHVVDSFDASVDNDTEEFNFIMQTTDYSGEEPSSQLISAKAGYKNNIVIDKIYFSRDELLPGLDMPVLFRLYNDSPKTVDKVAIALGGVSHEFEEDGLIEPGEYKDLIVFYRVPAVIENPSYTINAEYASASDFVEGTIRMNVPDAGIYKIELSKESERERSFEVQLYNNSYSKLTEGKHAIELRIYDTPDFSGTPIEVETISDAESLNQINDGILIKRILLDEEALQSILDEDGEIPEDGARIFFRAVLIEGQDEVEDADTANDWDYVKIDSLLTQNGDEVSITSSMQADTNGTVVRVAVLNNSMNQISNGNLVVQLRDENGNLIGKQQTYDKTAARTLLTIGGEETYSASFAFESAGASYDAVYANIADDGSSDNGGGSGKNGRKTDKTEEDQPVIPPEDFAGIFQDVQETDWFYEAVRYVFENELMLGTGNHTFSPELTTTRSMLVTMLYRLEKEPNTGSSGFTDVAAGEYYSASAAWAQQNGIVRGITENLFGPKQAITREQFAVILYRYALMKGYDIGGGTSESDEGSGAAEGTKVGLAAYADRSSVSDYAITAMEWAVRSGLLNGVGGGNLAPQKNTTRAEMAVILYRFLQE